MRVVKDPLVDGLEFGLQQHEIALLDYFLADIEGSDALGAVKASRPSVYDDVV